MSSHSTHIGDFVLGTGPRVVITCENDAGAVTDPTTMTITYRIDGDTTPATYELGDAEIVKVSTGVYRFTPPTPDAVGVWRGHTVTTGTINRGGLFHFTITAGL